MNHYYAVAEHWGEKAGYFDKGVEPDDSDCESDSGQVGSSAPRERVNCKKESEQELLPVLTIGSFAAYVECLILTGELSLTLHAAGGLCSSICARM